MPQRRRSRPAPGTSSNPFKSPVRIPRQIENSATLWLDFFQQFCDITVYREEPDDLQSDDALASLDKQAVARSRRLADAALETFQERFPGVYPA